MITNKQRSRIAAMLELEKLFKEPENHNVKILYDKEFRTKNKLNLWVSEDGELLESIGNVHGSPIIHYDTTKEMWYTLTDYRGKESKTYLDSIYYELWDTEELPECYKV